MVTRHSSGHSFLFEPQADKSRGAGVDQCIQEDDSVLFT